MPFAANWEDGHNNYLKGFNPGWQMDMIEKGHHILLKFTYNANYADWFVNAYLDDYFEKPIKKAAGYDIPIVFGTTQPEAMLYSNDGPWRSLPPEENPNLVDTNGVVHGVVSPFGSVEHWETVGECWVNPALLVDLGYTPRDWWDEPLLSRFQNWYPDPPFVIWLSNNEASDMDYRDIDEDFRFRDAYEGDPDYDNWQFRNEILGGNTDLTDSGAGAYETGHGYIPRYNAMFEGMRNQLDEWSDKIKFVGYENNLSCFARWTGWVEYIPAPIPGRFSTVPHIWDGSSPAYYVNEWQGNWDFTGYAPQLEAMNLLFQEDYYREIKPEFYWEISAWFDPEFIERFRNEGQVVNPDRYEGYIKWIMWLTRPRSVRDFKYSTDTLQESWEWYKPIVDAVDEVHLNPILERFWRYSEPVLLTDIPHPWRDRDEFWPELFYNGDERMRWYQLPNDITYTPNSSDDWSSIHDKTYAVWIMANVTGTPPEREWLIYAHATLDLEVEVSAELPGYGDINLTAKRGGAYYLMRESGSNEYIETEPGVRAAELDDIELKEEEIHRFNGVYSTAYKCNITSYFWDFGDGTTSDSIATNHSFSESGTYEVKLTVTSDSGKADSDTIMVTVGSGGITPNEFSFSVNSPARENALFEIYLPEKATISLHIYDVLGRLASSPLRGEYSEGVHKEKFSPGIKGIYFYNFEYSHKKVKGKIIIF
ncbi:PKD domain-containing protein [candidate division WOR-3 bacterium]|nr:PKD domain-containing protein [candidate division WOR-3 bacterium]